MRVSKARRLRDLLLGKSLVHMPAVYDAIGARLVEAAGFPALYTGGYVSGATRCISEPLMTMTEQIAIAADCAHAVDIPLVVDGGAGFGEPLHTMRTVRECIRAGIAGLHIEDQIYPKRAHYHTYRVHEIPVAEFAEKIQYACRERDRCDPDFVVIARTDSCREFGVVEACDRLNRCADVGADLGLLFPRSPEETAQAPRLSRLPLVYVMSRGNRDGRPIFTRQELADMGYAAIIDAQAMLLPAFVAQQAMLRELHETGTFSALTQAECVTARNAIEDLIGLDEAYAIERETVEKQ